MGRFRLLDAGARVEDVVGRRDSEKGLVWGKTAAASRGRVLREGISYSPPPCSKEPSPAPGRDRSAWGKKAVQHHFKERRIQTHPVSLIGDSRFTGEKGEGIRAAS